MQQINRTAEKLNRATPKSKQGHPNISKTTNNGADGDDNDEDRDRDLAMTATMTHGHADDSEHLFSTERLREYMSSAAKKTLSAEAPL